MVPPMPSRGALLMGALWLAGVVSATTVGLVAVQQVGRQVGDQVASPLTSKAVQQALQSASPASSHPTAQPAETSPGGSSEEGDLRTQSTVGGVVGGRCRGGAPTLLYATPSDGYRTERSSTQAAVVVQFAGSARRVTLTLTCQGEDLRIGSRTDQIGSITPVRPTVVPTPTTDRNGTPTEDPSASSDPAGSVEPSDGADH